ncbi:hypothetical protein GCM10023310_19790 [Paenibacillus vulneris]
MDNGHKRKLRLEYSLKQQKKRGEPDNYGAMFEEGIQSLKQHIG